MKRHLDRNNIFGILDILKFGLLLILLLMFVNFNAKVARQGDETKAIAASTNSLVRNQKNILDAIAQVTTDTKITAAQQTAIIICMLQVPIGQRTTDLQAQCRAQATSDVQSAISGSDTGTGQNSKVDSSANNTMGTTPSQSNNSQNPPSTSPTISAPPDPGLVQRILDTVTSPVKGLINAL